MKLKPTKNERRRAGSDSKRETLVSEEIKQIIIAYYNNYKKIAHFNFAQIKNIESSLATQGKVEV